MNSSDLYLIVIAGGSGTRFWPKSTSKRPKQLLSFEAAGKAGTAAPKSLLAKTLERFDGWIPGKQKVIVTTQQLEGPIRAEKIEAEILAEPQGRNTAPCIYWAARYVAERNPNGVMLIMPSDHYIAQPERFINCVKEAADWARNSDDLVTLGIQPSRPETGYGYLKTSGSSSGKGLRKVEAFVEKPNEAKATEYFRDGNYFWNAGMFIWKASVILKAFDQFMPEMGAAWAKAGGRVEAAYPAMTATSIDYGIMEKAKNVVTYPLDCGWDDLGSWTSLEGLADVLNARQGDNVVSAGELVPVESAGNIVDVPGKLVALLGVNDLIVVEHGESLLVASKGRAQDIRKIVEAVKGKRPGLV